MSQASQTVTISLPPKMIGDIQRVMKEEGRTKSELFREALRHYFEEQEWKKILRYGRKQALKREITEDQVENIVDAYRR